MEGETFQFYFVLQRIAGWGLASVSLCYGMLQRGGLKLYYMMLKFSVLVHLYFKELRGWGLASANLCYGILQ